MDAVMDRKKKKFQVVLQCPDVISWWLPMTSGPKKVLRHLIRDLSEGMVWNGRANNTQGIWNKMEGKVSLWQNICRQYNNGVVISVTESERFTKGQRQPFVERLLLERILDCWVQLSLDEIRQDISAWRKRWKWLMRDDGGPIDHLDH